MKIRHEVRYAASPAQVYEMRADPVFRDRVCEAMDTVSHEVTVDDSDAGLAVTIDMVQHTEGLPGFAKKIVGDHTRVVQTEQWTTPQSADFEVDLVGKPGHIRGRLSMAPDGAETVYVFDGEAKMSIPLIGGKMEGILERSFVDGMDTEHRVGVAWLAGERG